VRTDNESDGSTRVSETKTVIVGGEPAAATTRDIATIEKSVPVGGDLFTRPPLEPGARDDSNRPGAHEATGGG